jgi:hypothetical protein
MVTGSLAYLRLICFVSVGILGVLLGRAKRSLKAHSAMDLSSPIYSRNTGTAVFQLVCDGRYTYYVRTYACRLVP